MVSWHRTLNEQMLNVAVVVVAALLLDALDDAGTVTHLWTNSVPGNNVHWRMVFKMDTVKFVYELIE